MNRLAERIGYSFRDPSLLERALTHPSLGKKNNNQRLEFLGDAVLGLVITRMLYDLYPNEPEGELARRLAALVRGEMLTTIARDLTLGDALQLSASEAAAGGRQAPSNLEDALEALIGAVYLDGGLAAAESLITTYWQPHATNITSPPKDAKTALQEWAQARALPTPVYTVREQTGLAHAPQFTIEAAIQGYPSATASGASKRAAEQAAAEKLLASLPQ